jgi:hypothetical protein
MTAEAWWAAGPFKTDMDESDIGAVRREEEFAFRDRVSNVGRVVDVDAAEVFNDPRRNVCRLPNFAEDNPFCQRRGGDTF